MCIYNSGSTGVFSVQHWAASESNLTSCKPHINYPYKTVGLNWGQFCTWDILQCLAIVLIFKTGSLLLASDEQRPGMLLNILELKMAPHHTHTKKLSSTKCY